jgi:hypothetical protein
VLVLQYVAGPRFGFSEAFDQLVVAHFGPSVFTGVPDTILAVGLCAVLGWMLASTVGLFWFKRWARLGFWLAPLLATVLLMVLEGSRPDFSTPLADVLLTVHSATFGMIILLSYAKDYGADWFRPDAAVEKV